jgi:hypothetical protein
VGGRDRYIYTAMGGRSAEYDLLDSLVSLLTVVFVYRDRWRSVQEAGQKKVKVRRVEEEKKREERKKKGMSGGEGGTEGLLNEREQERRRVSQRGANWDYSYFYLLPYRAKPAAMDVSERVFWWRRRRRMRE